MPSVPIWLVWSACQSSGMRQDAIGVMTVHERREREKQKEGQEERGSCMHWVGGLVSLTCPGHVAPMDRRWSEGHQRTDTSDHGECQVIKWEGGGRGEREVCSLSRSCLHILSVLSPSIDPAPTDQMSTGESRRR